MKRISMTLVFDLSEYNDNPKKYARIENGLGFNYFNMEFLETSSKAEHMIRTRLNLAQRLYGSEICISHPKAIVCFNYRTLKHEFYKEENFNDYVYPKYFQFPINFKGSPIAKLFSKKVA